MDEPNRTTVAIGCQGGGMHAAFEVGVLTRILKASAKPECKFKIVGLSGTSAGALCALMAWYGLAPKKGRSGEVVPGSAAEAISALKDFWEQFVARPGAESILNQLTVGAFQIAETEIPFFGLGAGSLSLNPAGAVFRAVADWLPILGIRQEYFDLEYVLKKACPEFEKVDWDTVETRLLVGASEAINGYETVFDSDLNKPGADKPEKPPKRWRQRLPLSLAGVAASGTLPSVREAQQIEDCGAYWDGLYSQNPPVRDFVEERSKAPDEIWILRINPQTCPRLPVTLGEIRDRENELMGNLSLHKDLDFIQKVNDLGKLVRQIRKNQPAVQSLVDEKTGKSFDIGPMLDQLERRTKDVTVRTIKMREKTCDELQYSSKFNRSHEALHRLRTEGEEVAEDFLGDWRPNPDPDGPHCYPEDAGYRKH
jgi:NTE family protein